MSRHIPKENYDSNDPQNVKLTKDQVYKNQVQPVSKNTAPYDRIAMEYNNSVLEKTLGELYGEKSRCIFSNEVLVALVVSRDTDRLLKYNEAYKFLNIPTKDDFDYWVNYFLTHDVEQIVTLGKLVVEIAFEVIARYLNHCKNMLLLERIYLKGTSLKERMKFYHDEFKLIQGEVPLGGLTLDKYKEIIEKVTPILKNAPENRR